MKEASRDYPTLCKHCTLSIISHLPSLADLIGLSLAVTALLVSSACDRQPEVTATQAPIPTIHTRITGLEVTNDCPTVLGNPTAFTATVATGSDVVYAWDFGVVDTDSTGVVGDIVSYTYPLTGVHTAVITATNSLDFTTTTTLVTVDKVITGLEAFNDGSTVLGNSTTFTATVATGSNVVYTWDFGVVDTDSTGVGEIVSYTYPLTGVCTAVATATNSLGFTTTTTLVTVDKVITGLEAFNDGPTMLDNPTTFTATVATGSNVVYTWDFGVVDTDSTGVGEIVGYTYSLTGVHTAVVTATNSVGLTTTTTLVTADQDISGLAVTNDSPTVRGCPTTFTTTVATGSNVVYTWDFGDGYTGSGAIVTYTYPAVGVYTAAVTATNSVNLVTSTTPVTVNKDFESDDNEDGPPVVPRPELIGSVIIGCNANFKWSWSEELAENEYFAVRVGKVGIDQKPLSRKWTKKYEHPYPVCDGQYVWEIAICRGDPSLGNCEQLAVSERDAFEVTGCRCRTR
jgi:hypothetical protein